MRLWINGTKIIDSWSQFVPGGVQGTITLAADQLYDIKLEYFENTGAASVKLEWSSTYQVRQVVHPNRLSPNVSTIGDRVWLDFNGNGCQDDGETGLANTRVRILDATTGEDVVPSTTTDGTGNFRFVVPAGQSYRLQFGDPGATYSYTTQAQAGVPEDKNSDADASGLTAALQSPAAGLRDMTRDAGIRYRFDLDVNADGDLNDAEDGVANYLPGYAGATSKVSYGDSFNTPGYTGQRMKLILEGFGTDNAAITKIVFTIDDVTSHPGYASNRSDASLEGEANDDDFSFQRLGDSPSRTITMYGTYSWVNFYCKDYGGFARVLAQVWVRDGDGEIALPAIALSTSVDVDSDRIADKWEIEMGKRWSAQYGLPPMTDLAARAKFSPADDNELADPDGSDALVAQAETGDAHTVLEEYRGYILDGGGLNGAGRNGHLGGHIRLDPARKEILVEVDRAATINNIPTVGLPGVMNGASGVFSNATRGAGIYMYWLMDEVALNLPLSVNPLNIQKLDVEIPAALIASRYSVADRATAATFQSLSTDFMHLVFIDDLGGYKSGALTFSGGNALKAHGSLVAISDLNDPDPIWGLNPQTVDQHMMTTVAHEITHGLYNKRLFPDSCG